jgi:hypothetical protein
MKKIAYNAPEMEVLNLNLSSAILEVSMNGGDPAIHNEEPGEDVPVIID